MQQKNLILFIVLSLAIVLGWGQLQNWIWPRKQRPPAPPPWTEDVQREAAAFARLASLATTTGPGIDQVAALVAEFRLSNPQRDLQPLTRPEVAVNPWPWRSFADYTQNSIIARLVGGSAPASAGLADAGRVAADLQLAYMRPDMRTQPARPKPQEIVLGNDPASADNEFNLNVILSTQGGCVRQVILNKFQQADTMGLPEWQDEKRTVKVPLHLVPESSVRRQGPQHAGDLTESYYHYLLYHYAEIKDERPLETLARRLWKVVPGSIKNNPEDPVHEVVFVSPDDVPGLDVRIFKKYTLERRTYHIGLEVKVQNQRPEKLAFRYQLAGARGLPIEGEWYTTTYRNALFGWNEKGQTYRNLEDSRQVAVWEGGDKLERGDSGGKVIRYAAVAVQFFTSALVVDTLENQPTHKDDFLARVRATLETAALKGRVKKIDLAEDELVLSADRDYTFEVPRSAFALRDKLSVVKAGNEIVVVWKPRGDVLRKLRGDQKIEIDRVAIDARNATTTNPTVLDDITVRAVTVPINLEPSGTAGDSVEHKYLIYNGPMKVRLLGDLEGNRQVPAELVERYENQLSLNSLTDYHLPGVAGSFSSSIGLTWVIIKFTNLMHWLFWVLHTYVFPWSYGICIILLTVMVRGVMFPISRRQARSSQEMQEKMAKLSPELKKLKEKYKDDFSALSQAQQELYRRHGVNPMATMGGCLLLFAQMPVFLGLYYALQESIFLRLAPFFSWLPWIPNLAAPDMLFSWVPWDLSLSESIPWISRPDDQGSMIYLGPYFNLLPIVAVSFMLVQQKMMTPPPADEQQEMQQKMMKYMMVFIGVMFYKVAAGLCVYFIASSLWGLAERKLNPRAKPPGTTAAVPTAPPRLKPETRKARTDGKKKSGNGTLKKMRDWWDDVLEQARKKGR